jgi:hypothetical protein
MEIVAKMQYHDLIKVRRSIKADIPYMTHPEYIVEARKYIKAITAELAKRSAEEKAQIKRNRTIRVCDMVANALRVTTTEYGSRSTWKLTAPHSLRKVEMDEIMSDVHDQFQRGCACDHDCCGCVFGGAHSFRKVRGHVIFKATYSINV